MEEDEVRPSCDRTCLYQRGPPEETEIIPKEYAPPPTQSQTPTQLCGWDPASGRDYEHRREWIEDAVAELALYFGISVISSSVMSNHFHIILRTEPQWVASLSDADAKDSTFRSMPGWITSKTTTACSAVSPPPSADCANWQDPSAAHGSMVTPAPAASIHSTPKRGNAGTRERENAKRAHAREWRPGLDPSLWKIQGLPLGSPLHRQSRCPLAS